MFKKVLSGRKRWRQEAEEHGWEVIEDPRPLIGGGWGLFDGLEPGDSKPFKAAVDRRLPPGESGVIATFGLTPAQVKSKGFGLSKGAGEGAITMSSSEGNVQGSTVVVSRLPREVPGAMTFVPAAGKLLGKLTRLGGVGSTPLDDPVVGSEWMLLGEGGERAAGLRGDPGVRALLAALTHRGRRQEVLHRAAAEGLPVLLPPGMPGAKATTQVELRGDRLLVAHGGYNPLNPGPPPELVEACEAIVANFPRSDATPAG